MREILSRQGFSEADITSLETRADYEVVRLQVERMQADSLLDQLQERTQSTVEQAQTLDQRWEAFKTTLSSLDTTPQNPGTETPPAETLEAMRARLQTEAVGRAEAAIRGTLIGSFFGDFLVAQTQSILTVNDTSFAGRAKRWFAMRIAKIFRIDGIFNTLQTDINTAGNTELPALPVVSVIDTTVHDVPVETANREPQLRDVYYSTGISTLFYFSGASLERNESRARTDVLKGVKTLSLEEIQNLNADESEKQRILGTNSGSELHQRILGEIIENASNPRTLSILGLALSSTQIQNLLKPRGVNNTRMVEVFGEEGFNAILQLAGESNFNLNQLSFEEIGILYAQTIPYGIFSIIDSGGELGTSMLALARESGTEFQNNIVSPNIVALFGTHGGTNADAGGRSRLDPLRDQEVRDEIGTSLSVENRLQLDDIIRFKNELISDAFLTNPKLGLSNEEYLTTLRANLNYNWIIILYETMHGNSDLGTLNPLNFPLLILVLSQIIGRGSLDNIGNSRLAAQYRTQFVVESMRGAFFGELTPGERLAFEFYTPAFISTGLTAFLRHAYGIQGSTHAVFESITGLNADHLGAYGFTASSIAMYSGNRIANRALVSASARRLGLGLLIKRAGWVGLAVSALDIGLTLLDDSSPDATQARRPETQDPQNEGELPFLRNIEDNLLTHPLETITQLEESTLSFNINGETLNVITYGERPHVVYRGKIWMFAVLDSSNMNQSLEGYLTTFLTGNSDTPRDYGIWMTEGDTIHFGQTTDQIQINISDVFGDTTRDFSTRTLGGTDSPEYMTLGSAGENRTIALVPIAEIETPASTS